MTTLPGNKIVKADMTKFAVANKIEPIHMDDSDVWGVGAKGMAWRITHWAKFHGHPGIMVSTGKTLDLIKLIAKDLTLPDYKILNGPTAQWHGGPRSLDDIDWFVVHDGELYLVSAGAHPVDSAAEAMESYFHNNRVASPQGGVDNDSIVRYLANDIVGYHCTNFNSYTVGWEQGGRAVWSTHLWQQFCAPQLDRMAFVVAHECKALGIPIVFRNATYLKRVGVHPGKKSGGVTTHWEHTKAMQPGDHVDPGPNYPMTALIAKAQQYAASM